MSDPNLFTNKLRKATRKLHRLSDTFVNAKLAMSINTDEVWAEGLLVFYEIFRFLERAMMERQDENIGKLLFDGLARTHSFEQDLIYYFGNDWRKTYEIRDAVVKYLAHLNTLLQTDSDLLIPYIYHLYMGLLSGGQMLRRKRLIKDESDDSDEISSDEEESEIAPGEAATFFYMDEISDLKHQLKSTVNAIAETLDENKRNRMIDEGKNVFELNNKLIASIKSSNKVFIKKASYMAICFFVLVLILYYCFQL